MRNFQKGELLATPEDRGYPVEYLLSRLRGRRATLVRDWKALVHEASPRDVLASIRPRGALDRTPEGIWRGLLMEYSWIYGQMNGGLRKVFGPFFLYTELRTLFICLRHIKDRKAEGTGELLSASLLSEGLKDALLTGENQELAVRGIERAFMSLDGAFGGLSGLLEKEGPRSVERQLTDRYLAYVMQTRLHPVIRMFFFRIIDSRNILGLYKALALNAAAKPAFLPGGGISEKRFSAVLARGDLLEVSALVREAAGIRIDSPDITRVEIALYRGITKSLRKEGRDPLGAGLILDYLWRRSVEAMNLSLLVHTGELERDAVSAELVC